MVKKTVLVTGIGGNVGQGILRNIRNLNYNIRLVGCNTVAFTAGNYLCDEFSTVPFSYDKDYIPKICKLVDKYNVDLIIPATDYEVFYLSVNRNKINCEVAASGASAAEIYLDKYKTFLHHKQNNIPFANTFLPSEYKLQFKECIAKPKEGRGSRGLVVNPTDFTTFNDKDYLIQELHRGIEITTALYVTKQKQLHGQITMTRSLENGTTAMCAVEKSYDEKLKPILEKIINCSDVAGSINLQSIVTSDGNIYPFEVNCRISGTNSIRSNFGFKDVQYTLQEYLYNEKPNTTEIIPGMAVRILMDVIYPGQTNPNEILTNKAKSYIF